MTVLEEDHKELVTDPERDITVGIISSRPRTPGNFEKDLTKRYRCPSGVKQDILVVGAESWLI